MRERVHVNRTMKDLVADLRLMSMKSWICIIKRDRDEVFNIG